MGLHCRDRQDERRCGKGVAQSREHHVGRPHVRDIIHPNGESDGRSPSDEDVVGTFASALALRAGAIPRSRSRNVPTHGGSGSQARTYKTMVVRRMSASVHKPNRCCRVVYTNHSGNARTIDSVKNAIRSCASRRRRGFRRPLATRRYASASERSIEVLKIVRVSTKNTPPQNSATNTRTARSPLNR